MKLRLMGPTGPISSYANWRYILYRGHGKDIILQDGWSTDIEAAICLLPSPTTPHTHMSSRLEINNVFSYYQRGHFLVEFHDKNWGPGTLVRVPETGPNRVEKPVEQILTADGKKYYKSFIIFAILVFILIYVPLPVPGVIPIPFPEGIPM